MPHPAITAVKFPIGGDRKWLPVGVMWELGKPWRIRCRRLYFL
jgi:hypothetical protein